MSTGSKIEWTGITWNPTGCDRISVGCDHCYALTLAKRLKAMGSQKYQADGDPRTSGPGFAVTVHEDTLWEPLRWRKPRVVFVNSMSDLFHARVPDSFIASVFGVMAMTPQHTFQVLTKRPRRMRALLSTPAFWFRVNDAADAATDALTAINPRWPGVPSLDPVPWPLPNVWAGTSIENDDYTWRADELRQTPAAVRFLSLEPLLGPLPSLSLDGIGWVIAGGESGPEHRTIDLAWARDIRDRCASQDVAFFFKLLCTIPPVVSGPGSGETSGELQDNVELTLLDASEENIPFLWRITEGRSNWFLRIKNKYAVRRVSHFDAFATLADRAFAPRQRAIPRIHRISATVPAAVTSNAHKRAVRLPSEIANRSRRAISTTARSFHCIGTPPRCTQRLLGSSPALMPRHHLERITRVQRSIPQMLEYLAVSPDIKCTFDVTMSDQTFDVNNVVKSSRCKKFEKTTRICILGSNPGRAMARAEIASGYSGKSAPSKEAFA